MISASSTSILTLATSRVRSNPVPSGVMVMVPPTLLPLKKTVSTPGPPSKVSSSSGFQTNASSPPPPTKESLPSPATTREGAVLPTRTMLSLPRLVATWIAVTAAAGQSTVLSSNGAQPAPSAAGVRSSVASAGSSIVYVPPASEMVRSFAVPGEVGATTYPSTPALRSTCAARAGLAKAQSASIRKKTTPGWRGGTSFVATMDPTSGLGRQVRLPPGALPSGERAATSPVRHGSRGGRRGSRARRRAGPRRRHRDSGPRTQA